MSFAMLTPNATVDGAPERPGEQADDDDNQADGRIAVLATLFRGHWGTTLLCLLDNRRFNKGVERCG